ncbi:MAG: efflux RND transporter periplasmic adaptor subunit [Candidatus Spechtbacterales bacterium]|nr:efflux RND transporter periplasmic adaptor subunit [Candidatus Spechtbacterales bacterium]
MNIFKSKLFISVITLSLIGGGVYFYLGNNSNDSKYEYAVVERGNISEEVSVTGRVNPAESIELAMEMSGRVRNVYVVEGERVEVGDALLKLDDSELRTQLSQYRASLAAQEAKLAELKAGATPEEIRLQEIKIENAKRALNDAKASLVDAIKDAYVKSDDAVRNKVDQFISGPATDNPQITFTMSNIALELSIEAQRKSIETMLNDWKVEVDALTASTDINTALPNAKNNLSTVKLFLDDVALAINSAAISSASGNTWKADVSTARTNVSAATSSLLAAEKAYNSAKSTVSVEESQLNILKAGATQEQINAQEAQVRLSSAQIQNVLTKIDKTLLSSPISGIVTDVNIKRGEIVGINTKAISLISDSEFDIEANIPEADIAKVSLENNARVTLDAYGNDEVFLAQVVEINPAEKIIEGVATYKTTLQFIEEDPRIKSGMTANIDIQTRVAENVLYIPQRAVINRGATRNVRILEGENVVEIPVEVGLRGTEGNIEIKSGLNEGDRVITVINE